MKLKLETNGPITLLLVTESLQPADIAILKAGIGKLLGSGKTKLLIHLENIQSSVPTGLNIIEELCGWANSQAPQNQVLCSGTGETTHAETSSEALGYFSSPQAKLLIAKSIELFQVFELRKNNPLLSPRSLGLFFQKVLHCQSLLKLRDKAEKKDTAASAPLQTLKKNIESVLTHV